MDRQLQTITKDGKRFLLIEPGEYRRLARLAAAVSSTSERRAQRVWLARQLFCVWLMI